MISPLPQNPACVGPHLTGSLGIAGTAAVMGSGRSVSLGFVISAPVRPSSSWNPYAGYQVGFSAQLGTFNRGFGAFIGGGTQRGVGIANGPLRSEPSDGSFAEFDAGAGDAVGGSTQADSPLGSGLSGGIGGKVGGGVGAYFGTGAVHSITIVNKPLGC